jgi:glycosyltransferase involved in cell wall biosynthesis
VNFKENSEILSKCTIGIYPRTFDHKRSILKIFSYIGAGLPVVTFDLEDTRVIKDYNLGLSVNSIDDFIRAIVQLKEQPKILKNLERNIDKFRPPYTWQNLSKKMSELITH